MKPIPYGRHHITPDDEEAVLQALRSDFLTQGPLINQFEEAFAKRLGVKYAVAVANGTAALHLSALALGVQEKTRVITTPITFAASANCIRYSGGEVYFADIDPKTALLDIDKVRELIESKPEGFFQGIIPVDLTGFPVNTEEFRGLADQYGLWILEDACHAPGAYFIDKQDEKVYAGGGKYAELAIYSFHPVKHIASGEGGMITTNSEVLNEKLRLLRTHGITKENIPEDEGWRYEMTDLGFNYRLSDIHSALGLAQLKNLSQNLERRNVIARLYDEAFKDHPELELLMPPNGAFCAYHLYVIKTSRRKELYNHLKSKSINAQVHYVPVHHHPYYKELGKHYLDLANAEDYYARCLTIPIYPTLTEEEQHYVIQTIKSFFS